MDVYSVIAAILALSLLCVVLAFIFNKSFRRDMQKGSDEAHQEFSFLGLSVKGISIVVIFAIIALLEWYVLGLRSNLDVKIMKDNLLRQVAFLPDDRNEAIKQIRKDHQNSAHYQELLDNLPLDNATDVKSVVQAVRTIKKQLEDQDLVGMVASLSIEDTRSEEIREMSSRKVGPWALSGKSIEVRLTVPGDLASGDVRGCPQQKGQHYELISALVIDGTPIQAPALYVTVDENAGVISLSQDCMQMYDFLQVSCEIANRIFTDRALICDSGQAKWKPGVDQRPIAYAVQLNQLPINIVKQ